LPAQSDTHDGGGVVGDWVFFFFLRFFLALTSSPPRGNENSRSSPLISPASAVRRDAAAKKLRARLSKRSVSMGSLRYEVVRR
jgi:hypothetical protein